MTTPTDSYLAPIPADKTSLTDDERIENIVPLPPPEHLIRFFPIQGTPVEQLIAGTRRRVREILHGQSDRLLVVIGPCSIHDPAGAIAYAQKLAGERARHAADLEILMRVYFEKPRTTSASMRGCASRATCSSGSTTAACPPGANSST
jgi:3-deoxy-7-phosphoheptulonate synthase